MWALWTIYLTQEDGTGKGTGKNEESNDERDIKTPVYTYKMVWFNVLVIKEHVEGDSRKLDHNICILYDSCDGYFYYYGRRDRIIPRVEYSGVYSYDQKCSFLDFLGYLTGDFNTTFTTELHQLDIHPNEYDWLSYDTIIKKTRPNTLLAAYDANKESRSSISDYLNMLVSE